MDFVNTKVSENACVVFSKSYCPYCTMAKDNLTGEGGQYVVFELDQMSDGAQIQAALQDKTGMLSYYHHTLSYTSLASLVIIVLIPSVWLAYLLLGVRTVPQVFLGGKFIGGVSTISHRFSGITSTSWPHLFCYGFAFHHDY